MRRCSQTKERLETAVEPIEAQFESNMLALTKNSVASSIFQSSTYFWDTHTIHPELADSHAT